MFQFLWIFYFSQCSDYGELRSFRFTGSLLTAGHLMKILSQQKL